MTTPSLVGLSNPRGDYATRFRELWAEAVGDDGAPVEDDPLKGPGVGTVTFTISRESWSSVGSRLSVDSQTYHHRLAEAVFGEVRDLLAARDLEMGGLVVTLPRCRTLDLGTVEGTVHFWSRGG